MLIENDFYKINICKDEKYKTGSRANKPYDLTLNLCDNMRHDDYYEALSIHIYGSGEPKDIILIGLFAENDNIAVLEDHNLVVLMDTVLVVIDCNELKMKSCKTISDSDAFFSLCKFDDGYILHGELEIVKMSVYFETIWSFSGADIFVSQDGGCSFYVKNEMIHLTDWNGKTYTVDKNGKLIDGGFEEP